MASGPGVREDVIKALAARQWLDYEVARAPLGARDYALYLQWQDLPEENKEALRVLVEEFVRHQEEKQRGRPSGEASG